MKKVMLVFGTRPEAIKMCPLARELASRDLYDLRVCLTGQHRDLVVSVMRAFEVRAHHELSVMRRGQNLASLTARALSAVDGVLRLETPDLLLVHGDTSTAHAAALAAFYLGIPIAHVEAGLRTSQVDSPFPEEFDRRVIDMISELCFCPTDQSRDRLIAEGKRPEALFVTGNTAIDALRYTVRPDFRHPLLELGNGERLVLVTLHRRESIGEPMRGMLRAIRRVAEEQTDLRIVLPAHPNPDARSVILEELRDTDRITVTEPLEVLDFHNILSRSSIVLTDSGGIQEEASALGVPTLVLRDETERSEGVEAGCLSLVGREEEGVYNAFSRLLDDQELWQRMADASCPFGRGDASQKIADAIEAYFARG